jgi:hypothetical protein
LEDEEKQALKRYWESLAGEEWCRHAYWKEYKIARRAFSVLQNGFFNSWYTTVEEIVEEWGAMYPEDDLQEEFELSDDGSECGDSDDEERDVENGKQLML